MLDQQQGPLVPPLPAISGLAANIASDCGARVSTLNYPNCSKLSVLGNMLFTPELKAASRLINRPWRRIALDGTKVTIGTTRESGPGNSVEIIL
jgi:hypothetical protein